MLSTILPPLRQAIALPALRSRPVGSAVLILPRHLPRTTSNPLRTFSSSSLLREIKTRYTAEHEWVALDTDSNIGTVGITDYAQKALGDVVFVELPSQGTEVKQGEQLGAVESVKAASDIYSPVAGKVTAVNDKLQNETNLLNKSPEENGWLCQIQLSNPAEFESLLSRESYDALTAEH